METKIDPKNLLMKRLAKSLIIQHKLGQQIIRQRESKIAKDVWRNKRQKKLMQII